METQDPGAKATALPESATSICATQHSIYLLYPFRWAPKPENEPSKPPLLERQTSAGGEQLFRPMVRLSKLSEAPWQPRLSEDLRNKANHNRSDIDKKASSSAVGEEKARIVAGGGQSADDNIWIESRWAIAPDMDSYLARLLSQGGFGERQEGGNVIKVWTVNRQNNIRDVLNGRTGLARYLRPRLAIAFSAAAVKRLEARVGAKAPAMAVLKVEVDDTGETELRQGAQLDRADFDKANATVRKEGRKEAIAHPVLLGTPIEIGEVRALGFRTGHGVLVAEIHIRSGEPSGAVAMPLLVESLVALCADRHMTWLSSDGTELKEDKKQKALSLRDIVSTLLGDNAKHAIAGSRVFTYTFAKLDEAIDPLERQRLTVQLACKYTDDYRIDPAAFDERVYQPFESISHLAALEGAVTLVENVPFEDRARANFLEDYGSNSIEPRYLPIVVVTYHAFLTLLNLLQDSRSWINLRNPSIQEARYLRKLRDRMLEFRLFHRLSFVSLLTMPNEFYHRLSHAFGLERMLASADRDVAELSAVIDGRIKDAEVIQSRWFRRLTAVSLAIISGATMGKIVVEILPVSWTDKLVTHINELIMFFNDLVASQHNALLDYFHVGLNPIDGAAAGHWVELVFAGVFCYFAWRLSEGGEIDEDMKELAAHTGRDNWQVP